MPIRVLDSTLAAQIAAGEVVERPASVVKELIENAIDAGASEIRIESREGGKRELRIQDNGSGIAADEIETAFLRHATSKLQTSDDLFAINTLGFRGEALPSIASVSQVTCISRTADADVGIELRIAGGELQDRAPRGCTPGTTFIIRNLFYNTPARLKFLRSDATEHSQISSTISQYALAYPNIRWTLLLDGKLALQTPGNGNLLDAIIELYGLDVGREMIGVDRASEAEDQHIRIHGFVSQPSTYRSARTYMHLFVNQRWIKAQGTLAFVIEEAYHTLLMKGRHPIVVLNLEIDPAAVDVNVHPTKSEVKFRNQSHVYAALTKAIREALAEHTTIRSWAGFGSSTEGLNRRVELRPPSGRSSTTPNDSDVFSDEQPSSSTDAAPAMRPMWSQPATQPRMESRSRPQVHQESFGEEIAPPLPKPGEARLPMLRVIGQISETYIIAESVDGMYLIDQHAAHERVMYEKLMDERGTTPIQSQTLLTAVPVELPPALAQILVEHQTTLNDWGFEIEEFGEGRIVARAVPSGLEAGEIAPALMEVADHLQQLGGSNPQGWREAMLTTVACHTAIRAGKVLSHEEMRQLLQQLERCAMPRTCPHGRPTMLQITQSQIERQFGRKG